MEDDFILDSFKADVNCIGVVDIVRNMKKNLNFKQAKLDATTMLLLVNDSYTNENVVIDVSFCSMEKIVTTQLVDREIFSLNLKKGGSILSITCDNYHSLTRVVKAFRTMTFS